MLLQYIYTPSRAPPGRDDLPGDGRGPDDLLRLFTRLLLRPHFLLGYYPWEREWILRIGWTVQ